jgi:hypothetical protein
MSAQIPSVAAVIIHEVEDFDAWNTKFEAHRDARKAGAILGHHVNRGAAGLTHDRRDEQAGVQLLEREPGRGVLRDVSNRAATAAMKG